MADPRRPLGEEEAAKPPVREADRWKGSGGTGRFPQQPEQRRPSELEREERRLERLRLIAAPWPTPNYEEFEPGPQEAA